MPFNRVVSFLKNSLAESSLPTRTEEGRQFFQERLALFGKCCFYLTVAAFVIRNFTWIMVGHHPLAYFFNNPVQHNSVFFAFAFAGVWTLCARAQVPAGLLRVLDVALVLAVCVSGTVTVFASASASEAELGDPDRMTMLATIVLMFRALILPSTAGWTLAVSLLVIIPTTVAYKLILDYDPDPDLTPGRVWEKTVQGAVIWGLIVVSISTIASRVIYNLRRDVQAAQQLGQYTLKRKLGEGAMGIVYAANHALLRRPTAVKILRPEAASDTSIARFEREVQLTSSLTHPNTIAIYDYGRTPDGMFYYAMEYLEGVTLQDLVRQYGPIAVPRTVHILRQVAASLVEAHAIGLIHRDIKPANIILCCRGGVSDVVKVVDFGLVKNTDKSSLDPEISAENTIAGTPHYMSPEASMSPGDIDGRSDIYSVGATAYYLLTGQPVFSAAGMLEVISDHIKTPPKPPSERLGQPIDADVEALVLRCLAKQRDDRFADTLAFLQELEKLSVAHPWPSSSADAWWAEHGGDVSPAPPPDESDSATLSVHLEGRPGL